MLPTSSILAVFVFSFFLGLGAVVSPGPVSTAIVSQAPRRGWPVGPLVATGHSILELLLVALIVFGLGAGLAQPGVQKAIAISGGVLLIWMGASMAWNTWQGKLHLPAVGETLEPMTSGQLVGLGMLATITNPFWYAWWVTVAAGYLAQAQSFSFSMVSAFYLGHISADYAWDTVLSAVVGGGRRWMTDTVYKVLMLACSAFFIYLGVIFLIQGLGIINEYPRAP